MALPPPFATSPLNLSLVPSIGFNDTLKQLGGISDLAGLNVVLVDLTNQPAGGAGFAPIGTYNAGTMRYIASTAKVSAMFASFRLRKNFREAAAQAAAGTPDELRAEITREWTPQVTNAAFGPADFPNLKTMFSINGSARNWDIQFTDSYWKSMEGMIGPSHNDDASRCILAVGFNYMQGALVSEGLYQTGSGGLWLGSDYSKKGRDGLPEPISKSRVAGNATALATLLVALANQKLVKDSSSASMRMMMNNAFMFRVLRDAKPSRPITFGIGGQSFGKLGIGIDGSLHDAAVIKRTTPNGKTIRYAAVILGAKNAGALWSAGQFLDDIIVAENGG